LSMQTDRLDVPSAILFGRFRLILNTRELLADGVPVAIGNRATEVLMVLIEARGMLVTKEQLLSRVWSRMTVEENNLQFQISTLRKALGKDRGFIKTVPRRGYRFVAQISTLANESGREVAPGLPNARPPTNLPVATSDLVGREAELSDVAALVASHRLVALVGSGGIGKTRLGIELAWRLLPEFSDGAWLVELAALSDPKLVPLAVADALGLREAGDSPEGLATILSSKRLLLVLDNCEHVIEAAASLAESLLHAGDSLHVIATSREPLRAEGEWVHRVQPLDVPPENTESIQDVMLYSAGKLFAACARASELYLPPDPRIAAAIAKICRRLDGIPLKIELAAASAAMLGVEAIASRLDERFSLLTDGRRTAPARHQSLEAMLDWSYALLREPERMVLQRLSIFGGAFTMEAASAVAAGDGIAASQVVHLLASLVAKSLVVSVSCDQVQRYRLRETTRAYAMEKLKVSGESGAVSRRLAALDRAVFAFPRQLRASAPVDGRPQFPNGLERTEVDLRPAGVMPSVRV